MNSNVNEIASRIDHTILKPDSTNIDIERLCRETSEYNFASVCVLPYFVKYAKKLLRRESKICTVIGFPLGGTYISSKLDECENALDDGADEIDMVMNIAAFMSKDYQRVSDDIKTIVEASHQSEVIVKVIVETCLLNDFQKIDICKIVSDCGSDYIKTSTGFSNSGATIHDVEQLKKYCSESVKVKASGGIKTAQFAIDLINAGADRLGTSSGIKIIHELQDLSG